MMERIQKEIVEPQIAAAKAEAAAKETPAAEKKAESVEGVAQIGIEDFSKVELRVAEVLSCEKMKKSKKLLKLLVSDGDGERQVLSGISQWYEPCLLYTSRARENIRLLLGATVETIIGDKQVTGIVLRSTKDESLSEQTVSGVFVAVGLDPNTSLFKGQLDLDGGYICAGEDCRTSLPGVFAAGDVRTKPLRQLVTAASDGAVAAVEAGKYLS